MSPHTAAASQAPFQKKERIFGWEGDAEIIITADISIEWW